MEKWSKNFNFKCKLQNVRRKVSNYILILMEILFFIFLRHFYWKYIGTRHCLYRNKIFWNIHWFFTTQTKRVRFNMGSPLTHVSNWNLNIWFWLLLKILAQEFLGEKLQQRNNSIIWRLNDKIMNSGDHYSHSFAEPY